MTKRALLLPLFWVVACGTGTGGSGASSAGGDNAGAGGSGSGNAPGEGGTGGLALVCVDDGVCDLPGGEQCSQCNDCFVQSPACGECFNDGECDPEDDACTCDDCDGNPACTTCVEDGVCDHSTEGCSCEDCIAAHWCD